MENCKIFVLIFVATLCFCSTFTDSAALRSQVERANLHTILKRLDGILDNLIEENSGTKLRDDTDGSVSYLTSKRNEDGSIPYKRNEDGSIPYKRNEDGSIPYKRNEDGSIPYKRNEDGSIPYKRNEDGSIPYKRNEDGSIPYKRNEDGSIPYKRGSLLSRNNDASLHEVLNYLLELEDENRARLPQKRDHGV